MGKKCDGAISIFLAVTLIVILSLILSLLETARYYAGKGYCGILLKAATESVMAGFYGPLFEEYRLYALDTGFGGHQGSRHEIENEIIGYIDDNVWHYCPQSCTVTDTEPFLNPSVNNYFLQTVEYEKYGAAGDALEEILDRIGLFGSNSKVTKIYARKMEIESKLAMIDTKLLELMKEIDGVDFISDMSGGYQICDGFAKKFFKGSPSMESVPLNNHEVYLRLEDKYVDVQGLAAKLMPVITDYKKVLESIAEYEQLADSERMKAQDILMEKMEYEERKNQKKQKLTDLYDQLDNLTKEKGVEDENGGKNKKKNKKDNSSSDIENELRSEIAELEAECEELDTKIEETESSMRTPLDNIERYEEIIEKKKKDYGTTRIYLLNSFDTLEGTICSARDSFVRVGEILQSIEEIKTETRPLVYEYENILNSRSGELPEEIRNDLSENLKLMKSYTGILPADGNCIDTATIKKTVEADISLLSRIPPGLFDVASGPDLDRLCMIEENFSTVEEAADGISFEGMAFDYSNTEAYSFDDSLGSLLGGWLSKGIMGMIIGDETVISDCRLEEMFLPSRFLSAMADSDIYRSMLGENSDIDCAGLLDLVQADDSEINRISSLAGDNSPGFTDKLLWILYQNSHFKDFTWSESKGNTVLEYEMEYILSGKMKDSQNLLNVTGKILLIRFAAAAVYAFTSIELQGKITAMLGAFRLPFISSLLQCIITVLMAFEQAVVETSAILKGKKVDVLTNSKTFCINIGDIITLPYIVDSKAKKFKDSALGLKYRDYLIILMLIGDVDELSARSLDIIQENIRYKYNEDFFFYNSIIGMSAECEFKAETEFVTLIPGLSEMLGTDVYTVVVGDEVHY